MLVYSLGMTLYWSVDFHLPQNQVGAPLSQSCAFKIRTILLLYYTDLNEFPSSPLSARPVEWPSKQPTPQHVWGHGPPQGDSHLHPGSLRISAQSLHPAPARQSYQTAGGGGFSWISESGYLPTVFSCLWAFPHFCALWDVSKNVLGFPFLQVDHESLQDSAVPLSGRSQMIRERLHGEHAWLCVGLLWVYWKNCMRLTKAKWIFWCLLLAWKQRKQLLSPEAFL